MQRPGRRELALLVVLTLVWAGCFALFVREIARGGPPQTHLLVGPPDAPDAYPIVASLRPGYASALDAIRAGDRLIRIGDRDLRGAMPWSVYGSLYAAAEGGRVPVEFERDGRRDTAVEQLLVEGHPGLEALIAFVFAATAVLLLVRAPGSQMVRSYAAATLVWSLTWLYFQGGSVAQTEAALAVRAVAGCLWAPLMVRAAFHFPAGAWPPDRPLPRWPLWFLVLGLTWTSKWMGVPFPHELGMRANPGIGSLVVVAVLGVATRNYRCADALGRRQVRWVLLGAHVALAPVLLGNLAAMLRPDLVAWWNASQVFLVAIPIAIGIAATRSNLLDVDRLISGAASYTILLVASVASVAALAPWLAGEVSARAGIDAMPVELAAYAAVAVALVRWEPRLRERLERVFFAERHALQVGIDRLLRELADAPDATHLTTLVGERLGALLRPSACVIYARGEHSFAPVFARGSAVTPHFDLDGALVHALAARIAAVDLERDPTLARHLDAAEAAILDSLAAALLIPIPLGGQLAAFVVLGRKRSGDIYTATDRALLGLVGASASASLARFGGEALLEEARELQTKLRQYVPASIAKRIAQGRSPEAGERIVSVLFADLRGYTALAEGRRAEEIFALVSRYTEAVSRAVAGCGGTVVEFNGDGMMAVFGAPDPLPEKERMALAAARRIVDDVQSSALAGDGFAERLEVGVGVATGPAYVGAIRSVDRYIWSALGNTTNLAARLQSLTRDLDAPIVIDAATRAAAGAGAADFVEHRAVAIRGMRSTSDVYALPRRRHAAA
jgi:class 3 adenylate cyclase